MKVHNTKDTSKLKVPSAKVVEDSVQKEVNKKKGKKKKERNVFVCYHCGNDIMNSIELVFKPIAVMKKKLVWVNRSFHMDCMLDYVDKSKNVEFRKQENDDWDKVYKYFRKEYLGLADSVNLDTHAVRRLLGLRVGMYYPRGNNTRVLDRGYPFSTIYKAMLVAKHKAMTNASAMNFTGISHKVNYFMKFIVSEIPDIHMRITEVEKSNKALQQEVEAGKAPVEMIDYLEDLQKRKSTEDETPTMDVNELWGEYNFGNEEEWD